MSTEIIVAIVAALATIIVAIIAAIGVAIESSRRYAATRERDLVEKIDKINVRLVGLSLKTDTLWEIYGEEVIRSARISGVIASQSEETPTGKWDNLVPVQITEDIQDESATLALVFNSPYDIFVEVWQIHKEELVQISRERNLSISILAGGVLTIVENAINNNSD